MAIDKRRTTTISSAAPLLIALLALVLCVGPLAAQRMARPRIIGTIRTAPAAPAARLAAEEGRKAEDETEDPAEDKFPGGAALKTDPEQQRLLKRAEQCVADDRLDLAVILWQRVLDEAGDTLMTHDGRTYTSLADEVEGRLSQLDSLALKTYRITADGEAQAVLSKAGSDGDEAALAEVVRRYFVSSHGDDAAFKLGCLALDRYDFVGAARLFTKILERHPDPSMPRGEILLRLAVAHARVADRQSAEAALEAAATAPGARPSQETLALVGESIAAAHATGSATPVDGWPMALGGPQRSGQMPSLPVAATSRTLTELWVQEYAALPSDQTAHNPWSGMGMPVGVTGRVGEAGRQPPSASREQLVSQWRQNSWRPATQLLFDSGLVYMKSADDLAAFSAAGVSNQPAWRSVWLNRYELDSMSQMLMMIAANMGMQANVASGKPKTAAEILLFGDRVHQSMSIAGGVLYSIEGKRLSKDAESAAPSSPRGFQWGVTPRRTRTNWLAAYEAKTGKVKWHRGASEEDKEGTQDVGFLSAPVPFGQHTLLVPVTDGGTIFLYALRASDGSTLWKSYLCDEPAGGCSPWAEVQIAVDGRDAYIACGTGVVFAVDAVSGSVRWAVRYARDGEPDTRMRQAYGHQFNPQLNLNGWEDDVVIPHGKTLVVLASDCDRLLALDRRSGELLWESPRTSFDRTAEYCLGVSGRSLFVAGKNVVRRYDIPTGLMKWDQAIDDSFGRGVVTADAIYMPVKESIVKLDLEKGTELGQVGVSLTMDDPVGNLYSDGEKLWVTGAGRVYAMTNLDHRLAALKEQIAEGNYEAQLHRMRLYARLNKHELALADLRGAYELCLKTHSADEATTTLLDSIADLELATRSPVATLEMLADLLAEGVSSALSQEVAARRSQTIASLLHAARTQKPAGSVAAVLRLAPLLDQDYLLTVAAQTVDAAATADDRVLLVDAVGDESPVRQLIAIPSLARIAPAAARQPLTLLAESQDDRVRLAAARALLNLEDRTALQVLIALLESDNPQVRTRSHQALRALTGEQIAFASAGKTEDRLKGVLAWKTWYATKGTTAKLKLPLAEVDAPLGRTLIASHVHSLVIELDADHKERWRMKVANPWGVQGLPNGHRLVAAYSRNAVFEYDENGKEVWRKDSLPSSPYSVQRLENGNTLVACADEQKLYEIAPDGSLTKRTIQGRPLFAHRLASGNTLVALQQGNRVVEITAEDEIVWEARNLNGPCFAQRLETGNTLVVQAYSGKVVEIDTSGEKVVWSSNVPLANPTSAHRLPSGNTLIADNNGVHELGADGRRVVWMHRQNNVTGLSQF